MDILQSVSTWIYLHGVKHANECCEGKSYGKYGFHLNLKEYLKQYGEVGFQGRAKTTEGKAVKTLPSTKFHPF